jgi:uncharacterized protein (DUF924 family)
MQDILDFWFEKLTHKQHFVKDAALDVSIRTRFGRYPHRNAILGRTSTKEELAFLAEPGSSF